MKTVKIKKSDLLNKLRENREAHIELYQEAVVGYRLQVKKAIKTLSKEFDKTGVLRTSAIMLQAPIDNTSEYDKAISMLEYSVDDVIDLDSHEFEQYVLDNWNWKHQVFANNSLYAAAGKAR